MQFIDHEILFGDTLPLLVCPLIGFAVNHLRGTMHSQWLEQRSRIRSAGASVNRKLIQRSGGRVSESQSKTSHRLRIASRVVQWSFLSGSPNVGVSESNFAASLADSVTISKSTRFARRSPNTKAGRLLIGRLRTCQEIRAPSSGKVASLIQSFLSQSVLSQPQSTRDFLHRIGTGVYLAARGVRFCGV